ncbi:hypothetical protein PR048_025933 [Dryococelus australis]|uniref:Uncharacterized protein n=1 Tax=Dryococelus australis TaxID=614101 RepID=A0ABQ9GJZ1_9NEOP|nr:hypothetical protein PR048_025933 [Dryococelus australis]
MGKTFAYSSHRKKITGRSPATGSKVLRISSYVGVALSRHAAVSSVIARASPVTGDGLEAMPFARSRDSRVFTNSAQCCVRHFLIPPVSQGPESWIALEGRGKKNLCSLLLLCGISQELGEERKEFRRGRYRRGVRVECLAGLYSLPGAAWWQARGGTKLRSAQPSAPQSLSSLRVEQLAGGALTCTQKSSEDRAGTSSLRLSSTETLSHYSLPNKVNRVRFPEGSPQDFRVCEIASLWESCRTTPLVRGFSRDLPFPPRRCLTLNHASPSSALKTSMLNSRPNLSTHSQNALSVDRRLGEERWGDAAEGALVEISRYLAWTGRPQGHETCVSAIARRDNTAAGRRRIVGHSHSTTRQYSCREEEEDCPTSSGPSYCRLPGQARPVVQLEQQAQRQRSQGAVAVRSDRLLGPTVVCKACGVPPSSTVMRALVEEQFGRARDWLWRQVRASVISAVIISALTTRDKILDRYCVAAAWKMRSELCNTCLCVATLAVVCKFPCSTAGWRVSRDFLSRHGVEKSSRSMSLSLVISLKVIMGTPAWPVSRVVGSFARLPTKLLKQRSISKYTRQDTFENDIGFGHRLSTDQMIGSPLDVTYVDAARREYGTLVQNSERIIHPRESRVAAPGKCRYSSPDGATVAVGHFRGFAANCPPTLAAAPTPLPRQANVYLLHALPSASRECCFSFYFLLIVHLPMEKRLFLPGNRGILQWKKDCSPEFAFLFEDRRDFKHLCFVLPSSLDYSLLGHAQDGFGPIGNH